MISLYAYYGIQHKAMVRLSRRWDDWEDVNMLRESVKRLIEKGRSEFVN